MDEKGKTEPIQLRVIWVPQVPMKPFIVPVESLREAAKILDVLSCYDLFQYENKVKPDYTNMGSLEVFDSNDTTDSPDGSWVNWCDPDTDYSIDEWKEYQEWSTYLDECFREMRLSSARRR